MTGWLECHSQKSFVGFWKKKVFERRRWKLKGRCLVSSGRSSVRGLARFRKESGVFFVFSCFFSKTFFFLSLNRGVVPFVFFLFLSFFVFSFGALSFAGQRTRGVGPRYPRPLTPAPLFGSPGLRWRVIGKRRGRDGEGGGFFLWEKKAGVDFTRARTSDDATTNFRTRFAF